VGTQFTAIAWLLDSTNGTISIHDGPHMVPFTAGGSGSTIDCCASCGSGLGASVVADELVSHPHLDVAVPDGPNIGLHRAMAVSYLTWEMTIRGATYRVSCGPPGLVIRGPSTSTPATSVERHPFSATFSGAVFASAGNVVVTKA
jgi:hypothetical protein